MKLNSGSREFFGHPVQIDCDAGDAYNTCFVAENGDAVSRGGRDFSVNEELFDALCSARKADAVPGLPGTDIDVANGNYGKGVGLAVAFVLVLALGGI